MFSRIEHVRAHFYREHWDFGEWENERRRLRTFDDSLLKCQNGCGFIAHKLEELDDHVLTPGHCFNHAYNLHRFEEVKVNIARPREHNTSLSTLISPFCPMFLQEKPPRGSKKRKQSTVPALGEGGGR